MVRKRAGRRKKEAAIEQEDEVGNRTEKMSTDPNTPLETFGWAGQAAAANI